LASGQPRKKKDWFSVWDTDLGDVLGIEDIAGGLEKEEEQKRLHDNELLDAMMLMRRNAIQDVEIQRRRQLEDQRQQMRQEEYERRGREMEEDAARRQEQLLRPQNAIRNFWDMMNNGLRFLTISPPKFADSIALFNQASALMANEVQFLIPDTQEYRPMILDMRNLANCYSHICNALIEFGRGGAYKDTMNYSLTDLERAANVIPNMYSSIKNMCRAFTDEQKTDHYFQLAVDSIPAGVDSGAIILFVMALALNKKYQRFDNLIDLLLQKLQIR